MKFEIQHSKKSGIYLCRSHPISSTELTAVAGDISYSIQQRVVREHSGLEEGQHHIHGTVVVVSHHTNDNVAGWLLPVRQPFLKQQ